MPGVLNVQKQRLYQAWRGRHRHLTDHQEHLRGAAFDLIRSGRVATTQLLAEHLGLPMSSVEEVLTTLEHEGLIVAREPGGVVGIFGLSIVETPHALCLDGHVLFTWCALDAVGIPAGLDADATVQDVCKLCRLDIELRFTAGALTHSSTDSIYLWVVKPGQGRSAVGDT